MSHRSRRQITIERHSITRIRVSGKSRFVFCEVCRLETPAFTPEQAVKFLQISEGEVFQQIASGEFHLIGGKEAALICGNSIKKMD